MLSECYDVTFKAPMLSLARQCYLHPTVLPHNPIYSPTFLVTLLPGYHVTMLPCYHVTMLPCYHVTMLPCYMLPSILSSYFPCTLRKVCNTKCLDYTSLLLNKFTSHSFTIIA